MQRILLSIFLFFFLFLAFSQGRKHPDPSLLNSYRQAVQQFEKAEQTADKAANNESLYAVSDSVYLLSLQQFRLLIPQLDKNKEDSLGFLSRSTAAYIAMIFDSTAIAKKFYLEAIQQKNRLPALPDSFLFTPYLYLGGIYYQGEQFDSATFYYQQAEVLMGRYTRRLKGAERLYNRMGSLYYETGNYRQAGNYYEKAIAITDPNDKDLLANYKINIAAMLVKLEEFDKAERIYNELKNDSSFSNEIHHNLGIINLHRKDYVTAIDHFREVNYVNNKKNIDLYYNYAMAFEELAREDSAALYIEKALTENLRWNGKRKNISYGLILGFKAREEMNTKNFTRAAELLQEAIMQFDPRFADPDIFNNPSDFSGVFSFINLFNTLSLKAGVLDSLYQQKKEQKYLLGALNTWHVAFDLAHYVGKTYNSDEARLLIGTIKYKVHSQPIDLSLRLYELSQEKKFLEDAYRFDQDNKASVLMLNLQENARTRIHPVNNELLIEEDRIRSEITRLLLRSSRASDSTETASIRSAIRDYEIELGNLQERIAADPGSENLLFIDQVPTVSAIQKKLDNKTAVLSYHLSEQHLLLIFISGNRFNYYRSSIDPSFIQAIDSFKKYTATADRAGIRASEQHSSVLYKILFSAVKSSLADKERLVIIPDDELNYLPFEALKDENGNFLVQRFAITYQYSTALFEKDAAIKASNSLGFAPFNKSGFAPDSGKNLPVLTASGQELENLKGKVLLDSSATKNSFLENVNHYGIIHLATHASADNEDPSRSFIAFYPGNNNDPAAYQLFAPEIYNLQLDSTELVILSACETGSGQLIKGEGLMSLSRAFAYAGCPNIITSLWKAEDRSTAFIANRLHYYLENGSTKDRALQEAKLDLLRSREIDPRLKDPAYWAHLVFIGNYEPDHRRTNWWKIALVIIAAAGFYIFLKQKAWFK